MRALWMAMLVMALGLPTMAAAQNVEYHQDGKSLYIYPDEWDGDPYTAEMIVRFVNWRSGLDTSAAVQISTETGDTEVWDPYLGRPAVSGSNAVTGPHQRAYDGVDCWDVPAHNDRFGRVIRNAMGKMWVTAAGQALGCIGAGAGWGACMGGSLVSSVWGPLLTDTSGYLWTCYLR